jgi:hypothetical protein
VWATERHWGGENLVEGAVVPGIMPTLDPVGRISGPPQRLVANAGTAFIGTNVNGIGFAVSHELAHEWIAADPRNSEVLFPFLNGQDLNSSPNQEASRHVINFFDWPEDRARTYPLPFQHVRQMVKPRRDLLPDYKSRIRDLYWQYEFRAAPFYSAVGNLPRFITIAQTSNTLQPSFVSQPTMITHTVVAFVSARADLLALVSSCAHTSWVLC